MTLEEIKYEAQRHGYKLVRQKNPVPTDYKRNRKQELIDCLLAIVICFGFTTALCYLLLL